MGWNVQWLVLGGLAYLFAFIHLVRAIRGNTKGNPVLMLLSLSFGAFTVLEEYQMIAQWMSLGEMTAVHEALEHIPQILTAALWLGVGVNALALWLGARRTAEK